MICAIQQIGFPRFSFIIAAFVRSKVELLRHCTGSRSGAHGRGGGHGRRCSDKSETRFTGGSRHFGASKPPCGALSIHTPASPGKGLLVLCYFEETE